MYGQQIDISWEVRRNGVYVSYRGIVNGTSWDVPNPTDTKKNRIYPGNKLGVCSGKKGGQAGDPSRIRVDGAGSNVKFINKGLDVYTIALTPLYQGLEGYIDHPELYY
jgi:hypothetical protein